MALHTDLDIYREASNLFALMINVSKNMRRDVKQLIGSKLRDECIEAMGHKVRTNGHLYDEVCPSTPTASKFAANSGRKCSEQTIGH